MPDMPDVKNSAQCLILGLFESHMKKMNNAMRKKRCKHFVRKMDPNPKKFDCNNKPASDGVRIIHFEQQSCHLHFSFINNQANTTKKQTKVLSSGNSFKMSIRRKPDGNELNAFAFVKFFQEGLAGQFQLSNVRAKACIACNHV